MMAGLTLIAPLREPKKLPDKQELGPTFTRGSVIPGVAVIAAVVAFYIVFW
jgi:hypothetical protein